MTLCMVWKARGNIIFLSDSRLTFGIPTSDTGIKVVRIPFNIFEPGSPGQDPKLILSGDLGMTFAGSSAVALMMKEALAEVVFQIQGIPNYHDLDMNGISDLIFRGFKVTAQSIGAAIFEGNLTTVIFAGYCPTENRLRAFRMDVDKSNQCRINEILLHEGEIETIGSGKKQADAMLPNIPNDRNMVEIMKEVIQDPTVDSVGGNIQYGSFFGTRFQPYGVIELANNQKGVHYWRGPLDLNGSDFDEDKGLLPLMPYLDLMK